MNDGLIRKIVNRSNQTVLLWSILGLLAVGTLLFFNLRYLYNFFAGPFDAQPEQILQVGSAAEPQQYWVNLQGEQLLNTGVQYVSTSDSGVKTIEASYYAMVLGDRLLLVRLQGDQAADELPPQVTGWLAEVESKESAKIVQGLEQSEPDLRGRFLPYKLETGNFRRPGWMGMTLGVVVLLFSLWCLYTFISRATDPESHPIYKGLSRFGALDFVTNRIETELSAPHTTLGKLHLTSNWLVYMDRTHLSTTRYEDVVWVYKHILRHKSYGITVSKTFTAKVYDRFGVLCDFVAGRKEQDVDQMLTAICQRTPWVVTGYSDDLLKSWKKDRPGFLAAVERRKATQP